ncbi:hypothetical protein Halru_2873 [Halovivax ruber XH-70]|uniref:DUF58 domain-containing protein n=1 Tax=Halovivax ruber (strain DSM 18193 / JCM 13892 / XH-70) TaxID=797302 RepID=L0IF29_HALRX|nr:DUF58 domain-containing protein [Halovivax ruber]AGB17443.1 hypothetical protein Halru_2873 [Halovivax ruber XH-70]
MQATRRSWAVAALTVFLVGYGAVVGSPVPAVGALLVGAWFVGRQVAFVEAFERIRTDLTVSQRPARTRASAGERDQLTLVATMGERSAAADDSDESQDGEVGMAPDNDGDRALAVDVAVTAGVPTAAIVERPLAVRLHAAMSEATAESAVEWPVAGRHEFEPATVHVRSKLFTDTFSMGDQPTVVVEARQASSLHVGAGGERIAVGVGTRKDGRRGQGLEPAALRKYTAGDSASRIDWKATARLSTPYVREYEAETDRRTVLVVDARRSPVADRPGASPLDHLRSVALSLADDAHQHGEPLGLVVVGEDGIKTRIPTSRSADVRGRIRNALFDLEPTSDRSGRGPDGLAATATPTRGGHTHQQTGSGHDGTHPPITTSADAQSAQVTLDGTSAFDRRLRPFYADRTAYVERIADAPLFTAVDEELGRESGRIWPVILTDDTARAEVAETVSNARARGDGALVVIAPTVLYERAGLSELDQAYDRYVEFEGFRRQLGRQAGVTALEVGPADRLDAVLEAGGRT